MYLEKIKNACLLLFQYIHKIKNMLLGEYYYRFTSNTDKMNLLLQIYSPQEKNNKRLKLLYPLIVDRQIKNKSQSEIESIINRAWNGETGYSWAINKVEERAAKYDWDLKKVNYRDTYYILLKKLESIAINAENSNNVVRILEIGSGAGSIVGFFRGKKNIVAYGFDFNERTIAYAKEYFRNVDNLLFFCEDAVDYIKKNEILFDYIIMPEVLKYISYQNCINLIRNLSESKKVRSLIIFDKLLSDMDLLSNETTRFDGRDQLCFFHNYKKMMEENYYIIDSIMFSPIWTGNIVKNYLTSILVCSTNGNIE